MAHWIEPSFSKHAESLRAAFDAHAGDPYGHGISHEIWDYWFVPDQYTYLRTRPEAVVPRPLVAAFVEELRTWCRETLGLGHVSWPRLSLYVNGCGQGLHNDARNGRFGYVFSLTRWDARTFSGGETILFHEEDYWHSERIASSAAGVGLYDRVPALFNQLLVFDDRIIHGVQFVQGQMDPLRGRIVLHGHVSSDGNHVTGALRPEEVEPRWTEQLSRLEARLEEFEGVYDGVVSLRVVVGPEGGVIDSRVLVDALRATERGAPPPQRVASAIVEWARTLAFPRTQGETTILAPMVLTSR